MDAVSDNLHVAIALLQRRAAGDYTPDPTPESFPPFTQGAVARASGVGSGSCLKAMSKLCVQQTAQLIVGVRFPEDAAGFFGHGGKWDH